MARHTIPISDGKGSLKIIDGTYGAEAAVTGYDASTLDPNSVTIVEGTDNYTFMISATGVMTLHVTETGSESGVAVVGAKFVRTDSQGTVYGEVISSDTSGNAKFENVPFAESDAPKIYYKQIASDGAHTFGSDVKEVTLTEETTTIEVTNPPAPERTFMLVDANYANIPIESGQIILTDS